MNRVLTLYRYMLRDTAKAVAIFYGILLLVGVLNAVSSWASPDVAGQWNAIEGATTIFLFIACLNSFKSNFLFATANGITRRQFYRAALLFVATIATAMTLVSFALRVVMEVVAPRSIGPWPLGYPNDGTAAILLWQWAMNLAFSCLGLCITMLFYRANRGQKVLLALSPVILTALQNVLFIFIRPEELDHALSQTFHALMGLGDTPSALVGALSLGVAATLLLALCFLLVRRAPIKEQER